MKSQFYTLFLGLIVSFVLVSCADKQETQKEIQAVYEYNAGQYLDVNFKQDVLFRYEYKDETTGQKFGWLIDKQGIIRNYDYDDLSYQLNYGHQTTGSSLNALYGLSSPGENSVEIETLAEKAKLISNAANGTLTNHVSDVNSHGTESYFAYKRNFDRDVSSGQSCGGSTANHQSEDYYDQVVLKIEGHQSQDNNHAYAKELYGWMLEIQNNLQ